jgi:hypothetical protein
LEKKSVFAGTTRVFAHSQRHLRAKSHLKQYFSPEKLYLSGEKYYFKPDFALFLRHGRNTRWKSPRTRNIKGSAAFRRSGDGRGNRSPSSWKNLFGEDGVRIPVTTYPTR